MLDYLNHWLGCMFIVWAMRPTHLEIMLKRMAVKTDPRIVWNGHHSEEKMVKMRKALEGENHIFWVIFLCSTILWVGLEFMLDIV